MPPDLIIIDESSDVPEETWRALAQALQVPERLLMIGMDMGSGPDIYSVIVGRMEAAGRRAERRLFRRCFRRSKGFRRHVRRTKQLQGKAR